jgi:hypothetical protein
MNSLERDVLITVVERLRAIEKQQSEDRLLLLHVERAFLAGHSDDRLNYQNTAALARDLHGAEDRSRDRDQLYADILRRLRERRD